MPAMQSADVVQIALDVDVLRDVVRVEGEMGWSCRWAMFFKSPVMRLSMASTLNPSVMKRSHR